ncbi:MAG TPA: diguanylate cyclase [Egicoccus sp.]|nr:diguanylate cyclase [Egicoccus sp.]HSK24460.1 diguanylate cyclase [Egicoccus sp.]
MSACLDALATADSPRSAAEAVVTHLADLGQPFPSLYLLRGGRLRCQAQHGYGQVLDGIPVEVGVIGRCVRGGRTIVVGDTRGEGEFLAAAPGLLAEVCTPIHYDGRVVGALNVESREPLPSDTPQVLEACATAYGRRLDELGGPPVETPAQRVARWAGRLAELDDEEVILRLAVDAAVQVSGMRTAAIVTRRGGDRVGLEVAVGPLASGLEQVAPEALAALSDWVAAGTSMYTTGLDERELPVAGGLDEVGVASLAVVPLDARSLQLGILLVAAPEPGPIDQDMIASMEVLGSQVAASLLGARTLAQLHERARRDPMTGLGHGVTFREELQLALATPAEGRRLAVMIIDIDEFKAVNDRLGHLEGDRLLERLSATLALGMRDGDRLYRIGGDEFASILWAADDAEAAHIAQRLAASVRAREPITVSVGIATARPGDGGDDLVRRADEAMYAAKADGRDRTVFAGD